MGTLGRQGNPRVVEYLQNSLETSLGVEVITVLLSEIMPEKMKRLSTFFDAFVQTSCPRLSIDWGHAFEKPLLSPYEAAVAMGKTDANWMTAKLTDNDMNDDVYPMDFYAKASAGPWTPNYDEGKKKSGKSIKSLNK